MLDANTQGYYIALDGSYGDSEGLFIVTDEELESAGITNLDEFVQSNGLGWPQVLYDLLPETDTVVPLNEDLIEAAAQLKAATVTY